MSARVEKVSTPDGTFDLTVWLPETGSGPGLLLIQEIYGVSDYITAVADDLAALDHLAALPEVEGGLGVIGFCLGGTIAYFLAARVQLDAVVSFYGSGVPDQVDVLAQISAPVQFHFGGSDPYIPRDQVARVEQAAHAADNAEIHVEEDAGHAFHNRKAPMFHQPEAAARAWRRTEDFLARHLPTRRKAPQP